MVYFEPEKLRTELFETLIFIKNKFGCIEKLICLDAFDIDLEAFLIGGYGDHYIDTDNKIKITYDTFITLYPECTNETIVTITLEKLFEIIKNYKEIRTFTLEKCITPNIALYKVNAGNDDFDLEIFYEEDYNGFENDEAILTTLYDEKQVKCSIVRGLTLFGLKILENKDYNKLFPPILSDDFFIKIEAQNMTDNDYDKICNSYIFELSASNIIHCSISARQEYLYGIRNDDFFIESKCIRPLLFGKGLPEIITIYNKAIAACDSDRKIIEYTKVIEFVSQTLLRLEKTERIQCKLNSNRIFKADGDYIKELEAIFNEFKMNYEKDSGAIRLTIFKCCDIQEICESAPSYLSKVKFINKQLNNSKVKRAEIIEAAKIELAQAISDTRNEIAHAKANYIKKGKECPDIDKGIFSEMLRQVTIQVIRWYANVHENQRIT